MMIADLVDLEDFATLLRELGLPLPPSAEIDIIKSALEEWLCNAPRNELSSFQRLSSLLKDKSEGMVLPSVVALIEEANSYIDTKNESV